MFHNLVQFQDLFGPLRLFHYVTFRAAGAAFTAALLVFLLGPLTVRLLKKFSATAPCRYTGLMDEKFIDAAKEKTPSMGGILIILSIVVSTLLWGNLSNPLLLVFLGMLIALAILGFMDDYTKVAKQNRDGISGKFKLFGQILVAGLGVYALDVIPRTGALIRRITVPFLKHPLFGPESTDIINYTTFGGGSFTIIGIIIVFAFAILVVVGSSNAVNLTDGKDGLAVGCTIFCTLTYAAFAYFCGHKIFADYLSISFIPGASEVVVFSAAIAGACVGFLWHNCHPASMFMGDTGSLALGGTIGLLAVLTEQEITLLIVGGVFVMEAVSVIIQVFSFQVFGKRVFLCTPIHHHFEQKGWTETQIVVRFWILAGIFALMGLATLKLR